MLAAQRPIAYDNHFASFMLRHAFDSIGCGVEPKHPLSPEQSMVIYDDGFLHVLMLAYHNASSGSRYGQCTGTD